MNRVSFVWTQRAKRIFGMLTAALVLSSLFAPATQADTCTYTTAYTSSTLYNYQRCQMTDLDQRRMADLINQTPGLPNNGNMYCAPTAALDLLTYIANHGVTTMAPGPGYYGPESCAFCTIGVQYNKMTNAISQMGSLMGTDPYTGTTGSGATAGLQQWVWGSGGAGWVFSVSHVVPNSFWSPRLDDLASAALNGAVVAPAVGSYQGTKESGFTRKGGHVLALAMAKRSGTSAQIGLRDPALTVPSDDAYSQSAFTTETYNVETVWAIFSGVWRWQDRVIGLGGGNNAYIDEYFAIYPPEALTVEKNLFYVIKPVQLSAEDGSQPKIDAQFTSANNRNIVDVAIDPLLTRHVYLTEGDSTVWELDSLSGRSSALASVEGARRIVIGGKERTLYVLTPGSIVSLTREGRVLSRVTLATPLADITYDANQDVVIGSTVTGDTLRTFDAQLAPKSTLNLGQAVSEGGDISIQFDPATGSIIIHVDGSPRVWRALLQDGKVPQVTTITLESVRGPRALSVGDNGHLLASEGGQLVEFDGQGRLNSESIFRGLPGGSGLDVRRSFDNSDPRRDSDPNFRNG